MFAVRSVFVESVWNWGREAKKGRIRNDKKEGIEGIEGIKDKVVPS